jgi:hypothetical protein
MDINAMAFSDTLSTYQFLLSAICTIQNDNFSVTQFLGRQF